MRLSVMFMLIAMLVLHCVACDDGATADGEESGNSDIGTSGEEGSVDDVVDESEGGGDVVVDPPEEDVVVVPMEPTFTGVTAHVFVPYCASCHTTKDAVDQGELDFETEDVYGQLIDVQAVEAPAKTRVIPGDPDNSFLIHKLENTQGFFEGDVMPSPPSSTLDPELIQLVRDWIEEGAQDN